MRQMSAQKSCFLNNITENAPGPSDLIYLKTPVPQLSEIGQKYSFFLGDISQVQTRPFKPSVDFF